MVCYVAIFKCEYKKTKLKQEKQSSVLLLGIDCLRSDHMSLYGYDRLMPPHIDAIAKEGVVFDHHISPSIPTTLEYASMITGMDCFGMDVVVLRHEGQLGNHVKTLA